MKMRTLAVMMLAVACLVAQPQDSERQNALLSEVHELRVAIERSTLLGTRLQVSLQRIQMQEMRTTRMAQDHDRLKKEATELQTGFVMAAGQLKAAEEKLSQTTDVGERKRLKTW
jgi:hypothetical protein